MKRITLILPTHGRIDPTNPPDINSQHIHTQYYFYPELYLTPKQQVEWVEKLVQDYIDPESFDITIIGTSPYLFEAVIKIFKNKISGEIEITYCDGQVTISATDLWTHMAEPMKRMFFNY